jgi:hypothetical protein
MAGLFEQGWITGMVPLVLVAEAATLMARGTLPPRAAPTGRPAGASHADADDRGPRGACSAGEDAAPLHCSTSSRLRRLFRDAVRADMVPRSTESSALDLNGPAPLAVFWVQAYSSRQLPSWSPSAARAAAGAMASARAMRVARRASGRFVMSSSIGKAGDATCGAIGVMRDPPLAIHDSPI